MGSYVFRWEEPANEVLITGTFDNWAKSTPLQKENGIFQRQVDIPNPGNEILYKYVVDGKWAYDKNKKSADDGHGNTNNVLSPSELTPIAAGGRSSSGSHPNPISTSVLLAGSAGPGTTTSELAGKVPKMGDKDMPGAFPGADAAKSASKGEEQAFGVAPLPATAGAGNPISVKPGEKLPPTESITSNTTQSHVKLDRESYEKSDALPLSDVGPTSTSGGPPDSSVASDPTISSAAGSKTTTAALAGQVPKESDKRSSGLLAGAAAAGAATLGGAAAAVGVSLPASIQNTIDSMNSDSSSKPAAGVPETVKESQEAAHTSPEASSNPTAVSEKSAVERELTSAVHPTSEAAGVPPTTTAATSATAPAHNEEPVHATSPQDSSMTSKAAAAVTGAAAAVGATAATATGAAAVHAGPLLGSSSKEVEAFKNDPTNAVEAFKDDPTSGPTEDPLKTTPVKAFEGDPVSASHKLSHEPEPEGVTAAGATGAAGAAGATAAATGATAGAASSNVGGAASRAREPSREISPLSPDRKHSVAAVGADGAPLKQTSTGWKEGSEPKNRSELLKDAEKARSEKAATGVNTGAGKGESATGAAAPSGVPEASKEQKKKNRRSFFGKIKDKIKGDHPSEKS